MVVKKTQIFIYFGLHCSSQDGIAHLHYTGIKIPHNVVDRFGLPDLLS